MGGTAGDVSRPGRSRRRRRVRCGGSCVGCGDRRAGTGFRRRRRRPGARVGCRGARAAGSAGHQEPDARQPPDGGRGRLRRRRGRRLRAPRIARRAQAREVRRPVPAGRQGSRRGQARGPGRRQRGQGVRDPADARPPRRRSATGSGAQGGRLPTRAGGQGRGARRGPGRQGPGVPDLALLHLPHPAAVCRSTGLGRSGVPPDRRPRPSSRPSKPSPTSSPPPGPLYQDRPGGSDPIPSG